MKTKQIDKRLYKKPKYTIGDIIVYMEKNEDDFTALHQEEIIESHSSVDLLDKKDKLKWIYITRRILEQNEDSIEEDEILYKIK